MKDDIDIEDNLATIDILNLIGKLYIKQAEVQAIVKEIIKKIDAQDIRKIGKAREKKGCQ